MHQARLLEPAIPDPSKTPMRYNFVKFPDALL